MSGNVVIFINKDAININELFLNEEWELIKIYDRVYSITVNGKNIDWIIKVHPEKKYADREIKRLNMLKNVKGIPKILAVGLSNNFNYIILSRAKGVDLFEYVQKHGVFTEKKIRPLIRNFLTILKQVHDKGIIHKDLKPENIIYDGSELVLIDFEGKQTNAYRSPEQVIGGKITEKTDIWSTGIICYYLLTGDVPYQNGKEILNKKLHFCKKWSDDFKDFLSCLLEREICYRYNTKEALEHIWLT